MDIILASANSKKIKELQEILKSPNIRTYAELLGEIEIIEDGASFEENASLKARTIYELLSEREGDFCVMADDSGLCVEALGGMPGIYSARFASVIEGAKEIARGEFAIPQKHLGDEANNLKLLDSLQELGLSESKASFVCVIALCVRIGGVVRWENFRGELKGKVLKAPLNPQAFGYDPLFMPEGYELTMDQIQEKNSISHRFLALKQVKKFLDSLQR